MINDHGKPAHWWLYILGLLLLVTLAPVASTWVSLLSRLPFQNAGLQWITMAALGVALYKNRTGLFSINTSVAGLMVFIAIVMVYICAAILHIYTLYWVSGLALLGASLWALAGFQVLYRHLGLFLFALFLLPQMPLDIYTGISVPLQMFSTMVTATLAGLWIPITHSGNIFLIHGEAFEVTVACSGLNTWIGFLFAGLLWLLFERFSFKRLLFIVLGAMIMAFTTNTLRLFITAMTAHYHSADTAIAIHTNLEYILFPLGLLVMGWAGKKRNI